jgi:hypothetical protein
MSRRFAEIEMDTIRASHGRVTNNQESASGRLLPLQNG